MCSKINYFLEQVINNWLESRNIVKTHRVPTEDRSMDFIHKSSKSPKTTDFQRKISRVLLDRDTGDLSLKKYSISIGSNFCEKNRKISMAAIVNEWRGRCLRHTYKQASHRHLFLLHGSTDKYANHTYIRVIERSNVERKISQIQKFRYVCKLFSSQFFTVGRGICFYIILRLKYVSQEEFNSSRIEI